MTDKQLLLLILLCAALGWGVWGYLLLAIDPVFAGMVERFLFYLSFFLGTSGTYTVGSFLLRRHLHKDGILLRQLSVSVRQAGFFGVFLTTSVFLSSRGILTWWTLLGLLTLLGVVEAFFETRHKRPQIDLNT